jgi:hypothetical protein
MNGGGGGFEFQKFIIKIIEANNYENLIAAILYFKNLQKNYHLPSRFVKPIHSPES